MKKILGFLIFLNIVIILIALFIPDNVIKEDNSDLSISLIGDNEETLELNHVYNDKGATAIYGGMIVNKNISTENNIDITKLGSYEVKYNVKYKNKEESITRKINVVDTTAPSIVLNKGDLTFYLDQQYEEHGAIAYDNYDGNLTSKIEIKDNIDSTKAGKYQVTYSVTDSNGNIATETRNVTFKKRPTPPEQSIAVLNYHFFCDSRKGDKCNGSNYMDLKDFEAQLQYLNDNGFKTLTMEEFRAWMYREIQLPQKSVLITIDDGAAGTGKHNGNLLIPTLEKYKVHATLFLITGWWNINNYQSEYLDIASHTHDMHKEGKCSNAPRGAQMLCSSYDEVLSDLRKSIDVTGKNTAFCFPFYTYNDSTINAVKEAGFKLAFIGGGEKARRSDDKYKIPRYHMYKTTSLNTFINYVN